MLRFMKTLNNISRSQATYRLARTKGCDLCAAHHAFLLTVCRNSGSTQDAIATELCLNKSTVARTLAALEDRGYIERKVNPVNKREVLVYPTKKAEDTLPFVRQINKDWNESLTEGIADSDLEVFYSVLSRLEARAKDIVKGLSE